MMLPALAVPRHDWRLVQSTGETDAASCVFVTVVVVAVMPLTALDETPVFNAT